MSDGGVIDTITESNGKFRFRYITKYGGEYLGPRLYATKAAATAAGKKWLAELNVGRSIDAGSG